MTTIAVILSGCGVFDGSEIHESVLTLLALDHAGVDYQCFAPNIPQATVVNHLTKAPAPDKTRNALVEAARIARGDIKDITQADVNALDGAIYPGGSGAITTLSDFAEKGASAQVQTDVLNFAQAMAEAGKPQGFLCIAPTMITNIYGKGVAQTIGTDEETANTIAAMGGDHALCDVDDVVVDTHHKVVSTPCYMLATRISQIAEATDKLVKKLLSFVE